ncbi:hypothetical protein [Microscilla marina]|nr:hypothetical protein [Microscilla marina]
MNRIYKLNVIKQGAPSGGYADIPLAGYRYSSVYKGLRIVA